MNNFYTFTCRLAAACLFLLSCTLSTLSAQNNNMGIGTTSPDASAILDITSNSKGLLIPRLTNGQQGGLSGPSGLLIYNTDQGRFNFYNGGWKPVGLWSANGNKIFYNTDNVGIGTNNPMSKLDIAGGLTVGAGFAGTNAAPANGAIFQGNVGIGTNTLLAGSAKLSFGNTTGNQIDLYFASAADRYGFGISFSTLRYEVPIAAHHIFYGGGIERVRISSGGEVGIGTSSMGNARLKVVAPAGDFRGGEFQNSNTSGGAALYVNNTGGGNAVYIENGIAAKPGGGPWGATSDARLKTDVINFEDGLQQIRSIRPVSYRYNGLLGFSTKPTYIGIIAQELEAVAPYMVSTDDGYLRVDPNAFTYMLINAVQELDERVQSQQQIIEAQQAKLNAIEKALEKAGIRLD